MIAGNTCRVVLQVSGVLAQMSPQDLESHVREHWDEWQDQWRRVDGSHAADEMLKIDAGQAIYLVARGGRHYLVTEGTRIVFDHAA